MPIANPTIQQSLTDCLARQSSASGKKPVPAAAAADARDYVEALVAAGRDFNAFGICIRKGAVFYEGGDGSLDAKGRTASNMNPVAAPYAIIATRLQATRGIDDLVELNVELAAALAA